jgi:type VI secretion system protein VasI
MVAFCLATYFIDLATQRQVEFCRMMPTLEVGLTEEMTMKNARIGAVKAWLIIAALSVCIGDAAIADEATDRCGALSNETARLACYDQLFAQVSSEADLSLDPIEQTNTGSWDVEVNASVMTDDRNIFAWLSSSNTLPARFGGRGPARMLVRCRENTTALMLMFNDHHMADLQSYGRVEYRIDDRAMQRVNMTESTDNKALGLWQGNRSIPFIKAMLGHDQLIVRATPFSGSPLTATFPIEGIDNALIEVRETCGC